MQGTYIWGEYRWVATLQHVLQLFIAGHLSSLERRDIFKCWCLWPAVSEWGWRVGGWILLLIVASTLFLSNHYVYVYVTMSTVGNCMMLALLKTCGYIECPSPMGSLFQWKVPIRIRLWNYKQMLLFLSPLYCTIMHPRGSVASADSSWAPDTLHSNGRFLRGTQHCKTWPEPLLRSTNNLLHRADVSQALPLWVNEAIMT